MNSEIVIKRDGVTVTFAAHRHDRKGWLESYRVSLAAPGLSAEVCVENSPLGHSPDYFFSELAQSWRGWKGQKEWSSIEGEFDLVAVTDPLGHIVITMNIRPCPFPAAWSATASVIVEAGQLEQLRLQFVGLFSIESQQGAPADCLASASLRQDGS